MKMKLVHMSRLEYELKGIHQYDVRNTLVLLMGVSCDKKYQNIISHLSSSFLDVFAPYPYYIAHDES